MIAFGVLGIVLLILFKTDINAPGLELNRNKAITIAEKYLSDNGIELGDEWNRLISVNPSGPGKQNRFVWQTTDEEIYNFLTDRYGDFILLKPPLNSKNLILWFLPFIFLILGIYVVFYHNKKSG